MYIFEPVSGHTIYSNILAPTYLAAVNCVRPLTILCVLGYVMQRNTLQLAHGWWVIYLWNTCVTESALLQYISWLCCGEPECPMMLKHLPGFLWWFGIVIVNQAVVMCDHCFTIPLDPTSFKKGNCAIPKPNSLDCVGKNKAAPVSLCTACQLLKLLDILIVWWHMSDKGQCLH